MNDYLFNFILFSLGLGALYYGAEMLVKHSSRLALSMGFSATVVGLTVVAFGTSAPELGVTLQDMYRKDSEGGIALGNIVGSNICNVLLILGIVSVIGPLKMEARLLRMDIPYMIGVSLMFWLLELDGSFGRFDGALLLIAFGVFLYISFLGTPKEGLLEHAVEESMTKLNARQKLWSALLCIAGLALLFVGGDKTVEAAVFFAKGMGISEMVIGLTVVAVGTSLPELSASVIGAIRGQHGMSVGNVVGSNVFNLSLVLGVSAALGPKTLPSEAKTQFFNLPVMIGAALLLLLFSGKNMTVGRKQGVIFLVLYTVYTVIIYYLN